MGFYLIDTNVISNYFSATYSDKNMNFIAAILDEIPVISVISQIEALSWISSDKDKEAIIREFISDSKVISLSDEIISKTVEIRRSRKIKTPDAMIATTAICHDLTLISSDKDFIGINDLIIFNPHSD